MGPGLRASTKPACLWLTALVIVALSAGDGARAQSPANPPSDSAASVRSHDWRMPGFVAVVGGRIYDPQCVPLASVGSNVPNLPFRAGVQETLSFMHAARIRWIRVLATGHSLGADRAPKDAAAAAAALRDLVDQVQAYNAALPPDEAIYVLVALTDYYPPGVPGDRHAFDHPTFRDVPVLPAPWYRAGIRSFDFDQEHGYGPLRNIPNYEVFYKPWAEQIVAALADSPVLLGWQLGNELKARNSPRNGITPTQAYGWYLDFTRDIVDTIRQSDRNHPIFMGAQYMAELVDWNYRPSGPPVSDLLPTYRNLVQDALNACGVYCWNVWGLTGYDANAFPIDDAMTFRRANVASVYTEFGYTREVRGDTQELFRGDRAQAIRSGVPSSWIDIDGRPQSHMWSVVELFEQAGIAGIAPWGSPAPGEDAALDADTGRGITFAPDEDSLWAAWRDASGRLEAANRTAGPSIECTGSTLLEGVR